MISWRTLRLLRPCWPTWSAFILLSIIITQTLGQESFSGLAITPSNKTAILNKFGTQAFYLSSQQLNLPSTLVLRPLAQRLSSLELDDLLHLATNYSLLSVTPSNSADGFSEQIALISCDSSAYPGQVTASQTLDNVLITQPTPGAIILYSLESAFCLYETNNTQLSTYHYIFTVQGANLSRELEQALAARNTINMTSILPSGSNTTSGLPAATSISSGSGNGIPDTSPTTAVAMIILYSITGIITALFLGIIISGAVRAHRHPERYGPRNIVGRPRQSRARGLARAMLETIPIVKFGDDATQTVPAKGDVELASAHEGEVVDTVNAGERRSIGSRETDHPRPLVDPTTTTTGQISEDGISESVVQPGTEVLNPDASQDTGNHVCPICTDDFEKGQDVRVLPCNHQFHPSCVDPWLINVSGTCPLCRIDLNPTQDSSAEAGEGEASNAQEEQQQALSAEEPSPLPVASTSLHGSRRFSGFLSDPRRIRNASVEERIAALRQLRRAANTVDGDHGIAESTEEHQRRMRRLTQRFRDRFRILTHPHGDPSTTPTDLTTEAHST